MTTREFLDAFNRCTSHGWLTCEEALLLVTYAECTEGPIVEIGSYMGRSATLLGQLKGPPAVMVSDGLFKKITPRVLYCIDPWDSKFSSDQPAEYYFERFTENTAGLNVIPVRMRVEDWEPIPAGFVYLDGDHSYRGTVAQVEKALACTPAYIAVHDVNDHGAGSEVKRAATEILGPWKERLDKLAVWEVSR